MYTKKEYLEEEKIFRNIRELVNSDKDRLHYHLMAPTGWINDPNGLHENKGVNHIYFQYTPFNAGWGMKSWGHYTTENWISYKEEEPFIFPDTREDRDGAYSGSALVVDDKIHYFYTGNVKLTDKKYDYILTGREQNTIHLVSEDGYTFSKKELVLSNSDYPKEMSAHVRDPKVFKEGDEYLMVLGARSTDNKGCVLLYASKDLNNWVFKSKLETEYDFGYMWECPDMFKLNNKKVLMISPQGLENEETRFQNVFQSGYFLLDEEYEKSVIVSNFEEFDYGFDFYAPQTFEDEDGRRILIAWMGLPMESEYIEDPTVKYTWRHALTMPRELVIKNGELYQQPLKEFEQLRIEAYTSIVSDFTKWITEDSCFELQLELENNKSDLEINLREDVKLTYKNGRLSLELGESGYGRKTRNLEISTLSNLRIFSDTSSIEIFVNDGRYTMTSRVFSDKLQQEIMINSNSKGMLNIYNMKKFEIN